MAVLQVPIRTWERYAPHLFGLISRACGRRPVDPTTILLGGVGSFQSSFLVLDRLAETHAVDVGDRHEHRRVIADDAKVKETAGGTQDGLLFDPFDDPETMVRVDDLVTNLECHASPVAGMT
mgnify:CR=1 FL=1